MDAPTPDQAMVLLMLSCGLLWLLILANAAWHGGDDEPRSPRETWRELAEGFSDGTVNVDFYGDSDDE